MTNRNLFVVATLMVLSGCAQVPTSEDRIAAAIDNPNRSAADRERDARDHPEVTLALLNLDSGDAVIDIFGGGGYYAELLAGVVGAQGEVVLHNNRGYAKWVDEYLQERFIDEQIPPIEVIQTEVADLGLESDHFDAAIMVMSYHDLYYYNPERGFDKTDVADFFAQVHAAMKPGARLMIVDHAAADGTGMDAVQEIHRIDEAFATKDIESYGFRLVESSDVLRNPDDPRTDMVFAKKIRGKTDRFVLLFERL